MPIPLAVTLSPMSEKISGWCNQTCATSVISSDTKLILIFGPGTFSLDYLIGKKCDLTASTPATPSA